MDVRRFAKLQDPEGLRHLHLKLVAKVAIITGLAAAISLFFLVFFVAGESGASYLEIIQDHTVTRAHLRPVMTLAALILLMLVGFSVGIVALYTSFRVAGPLYRFTRNLQSPAKVSDQRLIRHDDALHGVAAELHESRQSLEQHYQLLGERVAAALHVLATSEAQPDRLHDALGELKAVESSVRLDG